MNTIENGQTVYVVFWGDLQWEEYRINVFATREDADKFCRETDDEFAEVRECVIGERD